MLSKTELQEQADLTLEDFVLTAQTSFANSIDVVLTWASINIPELRILQYADGAAVLSDSKLDFNFSSRSNIFSTLELGRPYNGKRCTTVCARGCLCVRVSKHGHVCVFASRARHCVCISFVFVPRTANLVFQTLFLESQSFRSTSILTLVAPLTPTLERSGTPNTIQDNHTVSGTACSIPGRVWFTRFAAPLQYACMQV